jgi:hypothetical protein
MAAELRTGDDDARGRQAMPPRIRLALVAAVAILLGGALYLIAVRGEALLADLSALSQRVFCF